MKKKSILLFCLLFCFTAQNHAQIITTIGGVGYGGFTGDGGPATLATIAGPNGLAIDNSGLLYVTDFGNKRVRTINSAGFINTISGYGVAAWSGDGGSALIAGQQPTDLVISAMGEIIFTDFQNYRLRKINSAGIISTFAGNGISGVSGDGVPATSAQLHGLFLAAHENGDIYLSDSYRIRKVDTNGIISNFAGTGTVGYSGDGGPAISAQFNSATGMVFDDTGNLYIADVSNHCVRKINKAGIISTIAGTGIAGYTGDGGAALLATFYQPKSLAIDGLNNLYIADYRNYCIRKINTSGIVTTISGTGISGYTGDGGLAIIAQLKGPEKIVTDSVSNIYIGDGGTRVRMIHSGNLRPTFTGGKSQLLSVCENDTAWLNALLTVADADAGQTATWVLSVAPLHGTATVAYSTTSTGGTLIPTGLYYTPAPGYWGNDTFRVRVDDGISAYKTTIYVTVTPFHAGTITGSSTVCAGDTIILANTTTGGVWSSSNTAIATVDTTGAVVGVMAGDAIVSYTITNACGSVIATFPIGVLSTAECPLAVSSQTLQKGILNVHPNPATGAFTIHFSSPYDEHGRVIITNVAGEQVKEMNIETNKETPVNTGAKWGLPGGIYFVNATTPHHHLTTKVVISR